MKKLTILVALLMCVTIGGVYATWTYSGSSITPLTGVPAPKEMGEVEFIGSSGAYHADSNTLKLVVEPKEGTLDTELTFTGTLVIKFTPSGDISTGPLAKALNAVITITGIDLETTKYNNTQIYTLDSSFKIELNETSWDNSRGDGSYYYTLDATALEAAISMEEFTLTSYDDFIDFQTKQASAVFKININPGT
jgi:hypothetical protein